MARPARANVHGERGAQAVEFALLALPLLLVLGAIIQFAILFFTQNTLTQAAREGARLAAICNQDTSCLSTVPGRTKSAAPGFTADSLLTVSVTPCSAPSGTTPGDAVVTVSYPYNLLGPIGNLPTTITGRAHMPCGG